MGNAVLITAQLPPAEALALLADLRAQYQVSLNEHWYDDAYRNIPQAMRHQSILEKYPVMAAQKRLMAALSLSLKTAK